MKKVLFIDKLDYLSLPLVLFSKLFFNTIVFRDSISFFRKIKINKFFEKINIKWINYLNLDCKYYNSSIKEHTIYWSYLFNSSGRSIIKWNKISR